MKLTKTINTVLFSILFLILPVFAFAQDAQSQSSALPDIIVKLQVPLPFVPDNPNLSQYLQGIYRLLIGAGALFAVIMIIIAGYQWMFSGGSSDKTGAAKKRILGAVVGLMLALLSYIILNSITPRLVALDMPFVPPVQRLDWEVGETCKNSQELKKLEDSGLELKVYKKDEYNEKNPTVGLVTGGREYANCARKFDVYAQDTKDNALKHVYDCTGDYCTDNQVCILNRCFAAVVYGNITMPSIQMIPWSDKYLEKIELVRYCTGGEESTASELSFSSKPGFYMVPRPDGFARDRCTRAADKIMGYYLKILVNDELGEWDDTFYTGKDRIIRKEMSLNSLISFDDLNPGYELEIDLSSVDSYD